MNEARNLDGLRTQVLTCIEAAYDKGYKAAKQNVVAIGNKSEYERGLNDAWECAKKIVTSDGLNLNELEKIFEFHSPDVIFGKFSASEAIAKIKEYEDQQRPTNDEIHVGDEFYCLDPKYKYVVLGFLSDGKIYAFSGKGLTGAFCFEQVHKTGRNYPVMEILEKLNRLNENEGHDDDQKKIH